MLVSPSFPLAILLFLPSLIYSETATTAATTVKPFPDFNQTKCEQDTSVICLLAKRNALNREATGALEVYSNVVDYPDNDAQIILRFYNTKKILVEIWAKEKSVKLKNHKGKAIFGCTASGSDAHASSDLTAEIGNRAGYFTGEILYCRFSLEDKKTQIFPPPSTEAEFREKFKLDTTTSSYGMTRITLLMPEEKCHADWIQTGELLKRPGYNIIEIPYDNLFAKSITCPNGSVLMYYNNNRGSKGLHEATKITCTGESPYKYAIEKADKTVSNEKKTFNAGCQRRDCEMCGQRADFPCQSSGCEAPKESTNDGCKVFGCSKSYMQINNESEPTKGEIKCSKIKENVYDWAINGTQVVTASCPTELPCYRSSPLNCDPNCTMLTDLKKMSTTCREGAMIIAHSETETSVESLVCSSGTGKYKKKLHDNNELDLPDGSIIKCKGGPAPPTAKPEANTASSIEVYAGAAFGAVALIIVLVIAIVCYCRRLKGKRAAKLPTTGTTTATKLESTTTGKSSEGAKAATPIVQCVPIPPPTPIKGSGTTNPATPWELTERTPNPPPPTPAEQPTQAPKSDTKSLKSAQIIRPPAEETAACPPNQNSQSGAESTKRKERGQESDVETRRSEDEPQQRHRQRHVQRRENSRHSHRSSSTQNEDTTKRTQNDAGTKKTQRTQQTISVEGGGVEAKIPTKMPPKKAEYVAMGDVEKDSFDSDENAKQPANNKPLVAPTPSSKKSPYLFLGEMIELAGKQGTAAKDKADYENLITQKSEDDKSKKT